MCILRWARYFDVERKVHISYRAVKIHTAMQAKTVQGFLMAGTQTNTRWRWQWPKNQRDQPPSRKHSKSGKTIPEKKKKSFGSDFCRKNAQNTFECVWIALDKIVSPKVCLANSSRWWIATHACYGRICTSKWNVQLDTSWNVWNLLGYHMLFAEWISVKHSQIIRLSA